MTRRTAVAVAGLLIAFLAVVRPAVMLSDDGSPAGLLVLLRGQSGTVRFVNSVTEKPVLFRFRVGGTFRDFTVETDPETEAYYTGGVGSMSAALAAESQHVLRFCSFKGISITVGFYHLDVSDGCLEVKLLWTI